MMKRTLLALSLAAGAAFQVSAWEYSYWDPDGSGSWSDATRWKNGTVPASASGNVMISGYEAYVTDADYDIINALTRLRLVNGASLDLRFEEDHTDFSPHTTMGTMTGAGSLLIKSGKGHLVYDSGWTEFEVQRVIVTNGVLEIRRTPTPTDCPYNGFGVYGSGTLAFNSSGKLCIDGLEGDGIVTNMNKGWIYMYGGTKEKPCVFSGTLMKNTEPAFQSGYHDFTGKFPHANTVRIYNGSIGLKTIYVDGEGSLGKPDIWIQGNSEIRYLGTGETVSVTGRIKLGESATSFAVDGGSGGLTFTGRFDATEVRRMVPIVLKGTNTENACVLSAAFNPANSGTNGFNIVKKDSGVWRLTGARNYIGTVSVEDGTLEYESISELGTASSIGSGSFLMEPEPCFKSDAVEVPWAVRLGTHSTTGAFVYIGSDYANSTSRHFAVRGNAYVSSESGATLWFEGAHSYDAQGGNLILGGAGISNCFSCVTNGPGPLGVTKTGTGTWSLRGDIDLDGGVDVREGILRICNSTNYTWFRYTVKELWTTQSDRYLQLAQFGLYNSEREQQNLNLVSSDSSATKTYRINPGEVAWEHSFAYQKPERSVDRLFKGVDSLMTAYRGDCDKPLDPDNPATWISFTMRLPEGADPVKYYDVKSQQGYVDGAMYGREPKRWIFEGSTDGRHWDELDSRYGLTVSNRARWYSCNKTSHDANNPGFEINGYAAAREVNIGSVGVSGGGTLIAEVPVEGIAKLKLNAGSGGTFDGFSFAAEGELDVAGLGDENVSIPVTFRNASGTDNIASWTLVSGGEAVKNRRVTVSDGKVTVTKIGTVMTIR